MGVGRCVLRYGFLYFSMPMFAVALILDWRLSPSSSAHLTLRHLVIWAIVDLFFGALIGFGIWARAGKKLQKMNSAARSDT